MATYLCITELRNILPSNHIWIFDQGEINNARLDDIIY